LCDFEQWNDIKNKELDKQLLQGLKQWDGVKRLEKRHKEEALKEHKKEEERRHVAAYREEREKTVEHVHRAKAVMEENLDTQRKEKSSRCTQ